MATQNDYIELNDVKEIFPSTKTKTINKLITENSLTRLLNRLLDVEGYVISSELPAGSLENPYNYVVIGNEILPKDLEINIRGYYFDLGTYSSITAKLRAKYSTFNENDLIRAAIYVDESVSEFPELYGQDQIESRELTNSENDFQFPEDCNSSNITNIKCYDANETLIPNSTTGITNPPVLNSNRYLVDSSSQVINFATLDVAKITYVYKSSIPSIVLYKAVENEDPPTPPQEGLTTYTLTIFKLVHLPETAAGSTDFTIPLTSLHRFSSLAIESVDGGEIARPKPITT